MAILNKDYYKGEDIYSDGSIEDEILDIARKGENIEDLNPDNVTYPVWYHLSSERENIVNWYPFKEGASVLEVGAGCGAITGALCKNASEVVCVDLSLKRSTINFERHKHADNLTIMVGNLNDMEFSHKFDYVVLNGVLEYAIGFTEGDTPYETFLNNQLKYLKDDGKILIAIENKLGIKYFAGSAEDHTDLYFAGLNGYKGIEGVRTFTKNELTSILENCKLKTIKFFYPYPDYKFPKEIFTEKSIKNQGFGKFYYKFTEENVELFDESIVAKALAKEGIGEYFSNSFFVEASRAENNSDAKNIEYVKISSDRNEEFKIITSIVKENEEKYVYKKALNEDSFKHIENLSNNENSVSFKEYSLLKGELNGNYIKYSFLKEENLNEKLKVAVDNKDSQGILDILDQVYYVIGDVKNIQVNDLYSQEFVKLFGEDKLPGELESVECVSPANIDLIPSNIFGETIIDGEWVFNIPVPKAFIMWRIIKEITSDHPFAWDIVDREEIYTKYNILNEDRETYRKWDAYFALEYIGSNKSRFYAVEPKKVDLKSLVPKVNMQAQMTLYVDENEKGMGFSENATIKETIDIRNGNFTVEFDLNDYNINKNSALRFDPIEGKMIKAKVMATNDSKNVNIKALNSVAQVEAFDIFSSRDPQYLIDAVGGKIEIKGHMEMLDIDELGRCFEMYKESVPKKKGLFK